MSENEMTKNKCVANSNILGQFGISEIPNWP